MRTLRFWRCAPGVRRLEPQRRGPRFPSIPSPKPRTWTVRPVGPAGTAASSIWNAAPSQF
eukprot:7875865-Alexandrium_andersonii.AAC.1